MIRRGVEAGFSDESVVPLRFLLPISAHLIGTAAPDLLPCPALRVF
jgi:hypothetical protein